MKLNRILLLVFLYCAHISCNNDAGRISSGRMLMDSLAGNYQKYGYSDTGFTAIAALYKNHPDADILPALFYYNYLTNYYKAKENYPASLRYADSSLSALNKPDYENRFYKERATAYIDKAHALFYMKRYKDCYYYYSSGSIEAGKVKDSLLTVNLYQHLAMFLYEENNYAKAIYYYKQLLVDVTGKNKTYDRLLNNQGLLDNIAISFLKEKTTDSAIIYSNKAISAIEQAAALQPEHKNFYNLALAVVYGNLAQAYALAHNYERAEFLYKQSIAINSQPDYANENALITQQHLAEMYYEEKKLPLLYSTLQSIKTGLDTISNTRVVMKRNYLMNRYYAAIHRPVEALAYLEQFLQLKNEYTKEARPENEWDIFDQMKFMQSKYDMNLLLKDNNTKESYLWIDSILIFLMACIAVLLFIHSKKSKKNVAVLTMLNNKINHKQILLKDTLAQLEKENREKQHILHVVAHDLRNPIAAIYTLAIITEDEYEDEVTVRENLELIKNACTESSDLISSILEIAENDEINYSYEPVNINVLLSDNMHFLRMKAKEKNQHIGLMTAQEKGIIYADVKKINRVISNLVINAIKFSSSGSYIEITAIVLENHVTVQIKDNGIGIPEMQRSKIFNPFTEAKRPGTNGEKTFGLGLSISKQIVENHKGKIWFESIENQGTTFFIQFPKLKDVLAHSGSEVPANQKTESR